MRAETSSSVAPSGKSWIGPEIRVLCVINFFNAVGFGIQAPTLPAFGVTLGLGSAMVGIVVAAFSLGRMMSSLPSARAAKQFGERKILIGGLFLLCAASVMAGLSQAGWQLVLFRAMAGLGSAAYSVAALSLMMRSVPGSHRGRAMGLFMGAFYLGATAGPVIGALLSGHSPRLAFMIYAAGAGVSAIVAALALRKTAPGASVQQRAEAVSMSEALRDRRYIAALLANFSTGWCVYGVRVSVMPLFLMFVLQEDQSWVGLSLAAGAAVQALLTPVSGSLTDRLGRRAALLLSQSALCAAFALLLLSPDLVGFLASFGFLAIGASFAATAATALAGDVADGRGGMVMGGVQFAGDAGMVAGPIAAGFLAQNLSYESAFWLSGVIAFAGLIAALMIQGGEARGRS